MTTFAFDAFASYSTEPDYRLVQKTEAFLEGFHSTSSGRKLKLRELKICVDGNDFSLAEERPRGENASAIDALLHENLAKSRYLLVFCSRRSMTSEWVDKEIVWWLERREPHTILLAITEGVDVSSRPQDFFSERIYQAGLHLRPWYDFRGFRGREVRSWAKVRDAEGERVQLTAHLYGDTAGRIYPNWQRARDRLRRIYRCLSVAACMAALGAAGWLAWTYSDAYQIRAIAHNPPITQQNRDLDLLTGLVRCDYLSEAQGIATRDDERKMERLNVIGKELIAEGRRNAARSVYELALAAPINPQILFTRVPADVLANSILLGANSTLVERLENAMQHDADAEVADCALQLAKGGMFERGVAMALARHSDFENKREDALIALSKMAPDSGTAIKLLDEVQSVIHPTSAHEQAGPMMGMREITLSPLAVAYAERGRAASSLEMIASLQFERAEAHLQLAEIFASQHDWPMVQRSIKQAGPIADDFLKILSLRSLVHQGHVDEALRFAAILEADGLKRGELLIGTVTSCVDSVVGETNLNIPAMRQMLAVGVALLAAQGPDAEREQLQAKGYIAVREWAQAREHLANTARLTLKKKRWDSAPEIASIFVTAKGGKEDLQWIDSIPIREWRDKARARVAVERQYGNDGRPLKEWLEANHGGGDLGGPYEQWFEKCILAGDVATAMEASKGINNEGRRSGTMLNGVGKLVKAGKTTEALTLAKAIPLFEKPGVTITFDEFHFLALAQVAPALASAGAVDQALGAAHQITAQALRARALGAIAAVLTVKSSKQSLDILQEALQASESIGETRARDRELATMVEAFCDQSDVYSASAVLVRVTDNYSRSKSQVKIVRALAQRHSLRDARMISERISDVHDRADACIAILDSYSAAQKRKSPIATAVP